MTAPAVLSATTDQPVDIAVRAFLLAAAPAGAEVVRAQVNRVPTATASTFATFITGNRTRLSTNLVGYVDPIAAGTTGPGVRRLTAKTQVDYDIELYGPDSATFVQTILALARDDFADQVFDDAGVDARVLYASEPIQVGWVNEADQYDDHWSVTLFVEVNAVVALAQDFAARVVITTQPPADALESVLQGVP